MRDISRIHILCNKLEEHWNKVPDWRFGQLLCNVLGEELNGKDLFFVEENDFITMFDKYFNEHFPMPGQLVNNHLKLDK